MRLEDKVLAHMPDVAFVIDEQGRYAYVSPSIARYGIDAAEMIGEPGTRFIHPDDLGKVRGLMRDLLAGRIDDAADREYRAILPDGTQLWVEGRPSLLFDTRGEPIGYLTVLRDVTARRAAGNQAAEAAARRLFNHDVRTPLNGILAASELMLSAAAQSQENAVGLASDIVKSAQGLRQALEPFLGDEASTPAPPEPATASADFERSRRLRILAADDHPINLHMIQAILEPLGEVVTAENGQVALAEFEAALRQDPFDLVLLDVQMPVQDGLQTVRAIRSLGSTARSVPIIMVTACAEPEDEKASMEAGADVHMTKPIRPNALLSTVKACVAAPQRSGLENSASVRDA